MPAPSITPPTVQIASAVIPAAGLGTRLRPLTRAFPKEMLPIGREPVLAHIATELREAGITRALFVVSDSKPQIRAFFGDTYVGERPDLPALTCEYVIQPQQRGSGDALLYAQQWVGEAPFVVAFGDCILETTVRNRSTNSAVASDSDLTTAPVLSPLQRLMATHLMQQSEASILVESIPLREVWRYGVVAPRQTADETSRGAGDRPDQRRTKPFPLADIVEKPRVEEAPSNLVVAARWVLQPSIFAALKTLQQSGPDARGELNIPDAVRALIRAGRPVWAMPLHVNEARRDIGNFESFFAQFVRAALHDPEYGSAVRRAALEVLEEAALEAEAL